MGRSQSRGCSALLHCAVQSGWQLLHIPLLCPAARHHHHHHHHRHRQVMEYCESDLEHVIKDRARLLSAGDIKAYMQARAEGGAPPWLASRVQRQAQQLV